VPFDRSSRWLSGQVGFEVALLHAGNVVVNPLGIAAVWAFERVVARLKIKPGPALLARKLALRRRGRSDDGRFGRWHGQSSSLVFSGSSTAGLISGYFKCYFGNAGGTALKSGMSSSTDSAAAQFGMPAFQTSVDRVIEPSRTLPATVARSTGPVCELLIAT
jgi:hypothetical protein